jgi:hypothetical protein
MCTSRYDEGLFPALQEVRIAVHLEDTIRNITTSSEGADSLGEEATKALGEIGNDEVWCARAADDSFIAAFTDGEPGGLEKVLHSTCISIIDIFCGHHL